MVVCLVLTLHLIQQTQAIYTKLRVTIHIIDELHDSYLIPSKTSSLDTHCSNSCGIIYSSIKLLCGCSTTIRNMKPSAANTSGCRGVSYNRKNDLWEAIIIFKGKRTRLGYFIAFEDAVKARKQAENAIFGSFLESQKLTQPSIGIKAK